MVHVTFERLEFDGPDLVVQLRLSRGKPVIEAKGEPAPESQRPGLAKIEGVAQVVPLRKVADVMPAWLTPELGAAGLLVAVVVAVIGGGWVLRRGG